MKFVFAFLLACVLAPVHAQSASEIAQTHEYAKMMEEISDTPQYRQKVRRMLADAYPQIKGLLPPEPSPRMATLDGNPPEFIILSSDVKLGATRLAIWTNLKKFSIGGVSYGSNKAGVTYVDVPQSGGWDYLPRDIVLQGKQQ